MSAKPKDKLFKNLFGTQKPVAKRVRFTYRLGLREIVISTANYRKLEPTPTAYENAYLPS